MEDCNWFEVIDWDEDTDEIIHAVCGMPSASWPNCKSCPHYDKFIDDGGTD